MMKRIYLYGIINFSGRIEESIKGLEQTEVFNIPYQDMGVVVSEHNGQIYYPSSERVLEYGKVVEKLMEQFTVLPIRFLTVFNSQEDAIAMLEDYYGDFKENLNRLYNKAEFGIKVIWPQDKIKRCILNNSSKETVGLSMPIDSPAKVFLNEKLQNYKINKEVEAEADRYIAIVDSFFKGFAVDKKLEKLKTGNLLLNAYYLVEKEKQDDFRGAFNQLLNVHGDLRCLFSGPWPPYNFIKLERSPLRLADSLAKISRANHLDECCWAGRDAI